MSLNLLRSLIREILENEKNTSSSSINLFGPSGGNNPRFSGDTTNKNIKTSPSFEAVRYYPKDEYGERIRDKDGNLVTVIHNKQNVTDWYWHPGAKKTLNNAEFEAALIAKIPMMGELTPEELQMIKIKKISPGKQISNSQFNSNKTIRMARTGANGEWEIYGQWRTYRDRSITDVPNDADYVGPRPRRGPSPSASREEPLARPSVPPSTRPPVRTTQPISAPSSPPGRDPNVVRRKKV